MRKTSLVIIAVLMCVAMFTACSESGSGNSGSSQTSESFVASESSAASDSAVTTESVCNHSGGVATCQKKAICEKCGKEYGELAAHAYGEWKYNAEKHWKECTTEGCDSKTEEAAHAFTKTGSDAEKHWKECECGAKSEEEAHNYTENKFDTEKHWKECLCGTKSEETAHVLSYDKNDAQHWQKCDCGYETAKVDHVLADKHNDTQHWKKCDCGYETTKADHVLADEHNDAQHWQKCNCGYETAKVDHVLTSEHNETQHWQKCECGYESEKKNHEYAVVKSSEDGVYDEYYCACGVESAELKFKKTVDEGERTIILTNSDLSLDLSGVSAYKTVESITLDEISLGNNVNALDIQALKTATQSHGEQTITVVVKTEEGIAHTISVPVTVVTANIATLNDWKNYIWSTDATAKVDGYFVVTNDINQGSEAFNLTGERAVGNGFVGTVDGKGHSINLSGSNGFGLFGGMNGATVKNLTINKNGGSQGWSAGLLGAYVQNSVFENVTINITGANNDNVQLGEFTRRGVWGSKFTNFKVNIKNSKVASLFGAENQKLRGLNALENGTNKEQKCVFTDCVINIDAYSTVNELGHRGRVSANESDQPLTVYTAEGHTPVNAAEWATIETLEGIKLVGPEIMDKQYFDMRETMGYSLDLGKYSEGYTVKSIACKNTDLGVDPSHINLTSTVSGDGDGIVVVLEKSDETLTLVFPVCWVTAVINSADDWKTYMWCEKGQTITGYYVLGKTIGGITGDTLKNPRSGGAAEAATTGGDYGFRGTLDGRGYTLSYWGSIGGGLINALGKGAVIKNLKIENNSVSKPGWKSEHIFGTVAVGATIENVTIDFNRCDYTGVETKYGPLAYDGFRNCTVKNLTINIKGKVNTIIGGSNATYFQMTGTTFTNCVINLYPGATLDEIGHTGANGEPVYCGENETIEGKTPLAGFTVNVIESAE